ncbi:MAG: carbohydrate kinase [Planctomycetota bacterium]|nr:MAG: carbohydrate kinase [Planctomycetota bacterium]
MSSEQTFTIVGLGEILWDMLPAGKRLGGAPANFAYHAQALGAKGVVVSCIGDDDLGKEILSQLGSLGLDCEYIAVNKAHRTGAVTVKLDEKGVPDFTIHENVAWDFIPLESRLLELATRADAVCFGSLCQRRDVSRDTVRRFLKETKPDCLRIFDINIRQSYYSKDIVNTMLKTSNVLKLNEDELSLVAELLDIEGTETEILAELLARYELRLVVLTKGAEGSRLYGKGGDSVCEGIPPEKIADTVGAGDAFTAAVSVGLLRGKSLDEINAHANRLAGFVCSQVGATPKLPDELAVS